MSRAGALNDSEMALEMNKMVRLSFHFWRLKGDLGMGTHYERIEAEW
jgi:hypothetical protein